MGNDQDAAARRRVIAGLSQAPAAAVIERLQQTGNLHMWAELWLEPEVYGPTLIFGGPFPFQGLLYDLRFVSAELDVSKRAPEILDEFVALSKKISPPHGLESLWPKGPKVTFRLQTVETGRGVFLGMLRER